MKRPTPLLLLLAPFLIASPLHASEITGVFFSGGSQVWIGLKDIASAEGPCEAGELYDRLNVPVAQPDPSQQPIRSVSDQFFDVICAKPIEDPAVGRRCGDCSINLKANANARLSEHDGTAKYELSGVGAESLFRQLKPNEDGRMHWRSADRQILIDAEAGDFKFQYRRR